MMAQVEPMDIDTIESDFDNKENAFQHNNVLSRTPCTEKGYEELDVSELNMKLRYSVTPAASPMSKSFTGPCLDNRSCNSEDYLNDAVGTDNGNLTRSLNSILTKTEGSSKSKILPLQTLSSEPFIDSNQNSSIRRLLDQTNNKVIISANNCNELDDNLSLPSPCSSVPDTPEATTPTKEIPKSEGSPIMRGLKSVLSMFRPSQSPIPPAEDKSTKQEGLGPADLNKSEVGTVQISTPVASSKQKDHNSSKRSSPLKESVVFSDDLERELLWKDETTIIFKEERIPVHKLFLQNPITLNTTDEHMDISCDESIFVGKSITTDVDKADQSVKNEPAVTGESDNEFLDCETTFTKNESNLSDNQIIQVDNEVQMKGDVTIDLSNKADLSNEISPESERILKNTICDTSGYTNGCANLTNVTATGSPKICIKNDTNVISATINFLRSERIDNDKIYMMPNVDVKTESIMNKESQSKNSNEIIPLNEPIIDFGPVQASETLPLEPLNIVNNTFFNDMNCDKIKETDQKFCCDIEKLSENCEEILNINNQAENNEASLIMTTKEVIEEKSPIVINSPASDSGSINIENNLVLGYEPNIDMEFQSLQCLELKSNASFLTSSEEAKIIYNKDITKNINNNFRNPNSDAVEGTTDENHSVIEEQPPKPEDVVPMLKDNTFVKNGNSDCPADVQRIVDEHNKVIDSKFATQKSEGEHDTHIENTLPSIEELVNPTLHISQFEVSNANINIDVNSDFAEIYNIKKANDSNMTNVKNQTEQPSQKEYENNFELKVDENVSICNVISTVVDTVSGNDHEIRELQNGNDTNISKSPSEIPLPDEDNIEQNILEINDVCNSDTCKQDITKFPICELHYNMDVESKMFVIDTKCDQSEIKINCTKENHGTYVNHELKNSTEINSNKLPLSETNDSQTCITESEDVKMTEVKTVDTKSENMDHDKMNFSVQYKENNIVSKEENNRDISMHEVMNYIVKQDFPKPLNNECIINKVLEDNISEKKPIVEALNDEIYSNNLDKSECTNKLGNDNQQHLTCEKGVDEIDEEIITSANNSPYVSITDLDKVDKNLPNKTVEEVNIPHSTKTSLASPPPSPKIVSKGYNFNFDEIDDPFATKTKIRMSPTPDTNDSDSFASATKEIKMIHEVSKKVNRRKSEPVRKKPIQKKNMNSTLSDKLNTECITERPMNSTIITTTDNVSNNVATSNVKVNISESKQEDCIPTDVENFTIFPKVDDSIKSVSTVSDEKRSSVTRNEIQSADLETKNIDKTLVISTEKSTSSSEQYFSLGTSSGESSSVMNRSRNVFNLPEIDDVNFNPFATKSKMRMSPSPVEKTMSSLDDKNNGSDSSLAINQEPSSNTTNIRDPEITLDIKNENNTLSDASNTTISSKTTHDIDTTVREILTEDEDTVEGPFLEVEDFKDNEKVTDGHIGADMMNFEEMTHQERDENLENGELFIDADAFEFLLNQNKSTTVLDSGKESLFLKFDPLFAKRVSSDGILAALNKVQNRQSTPKKVTKPKQHNIIPVEKSMPGPSNSENSAPVEEYYEDLLSNVTKPMMVVNPAVSSVMVQKKPVTPKLNRRSLTFTSPAMAVIDRLLSLSGNSSHLAHDASVSHTGREHSETDLAITQLRELLAEKEINVHTLRSESKELKERLASLEVQVKSMEKESAERLAKINELNERLLEKTKVNKSMATVVEEYERTIASLIAEAEHDKKRNAEEQMKLIKERDEQTAHLTSMEVSFSDLHSKYEKSKQIILSYKANEDVYKKSIKEFQDNFTKMQNNYELLKQHATSKLNHANQELEKMNRAHEAEVIKMNAMIKRKELHITSLEETLAQKTKANEELTAICDELINKVG